MIGHAADSRGEIKNCQATGDLNIDFSTEYECCVGGIVENNASLITQCVNSGTIEHNQGGRLGGIAGVNFAPIHTSRNLSVDIVGSATMTGLLVGSNLGTIFECCTSVPVNGLPLIKEGTTTLNKCSNPGDDHN